MRNFRIIALFIFVSIIGSSCASGRNTEPMAVLFKSITLNKDISTANDVGSKSGTACVYTFLFLFSFGDAGISQAASAGGVKTVKAVDYSKTTFLSYDIINYAFYNQVCTIVRGD